MPSQVFNTILPPIIVITAKTAGKNGPSRIGPDHLRRKSSPSTNIGDDFCDCIEGARNKSGLDFAAIDGCFVIVVITNQILSTHRYPETSVNGAHRPRNSAPKSFQIDSTDRYNKGEGNISIHPLLKIS